MNSSDALGNNSIEVSPIILMRNTSITCKSCATCASCTSYSSKWSLKLSQKNGTFDRYE